MREKMEMHWAKQGLDFIKVLHVEDDPHFREVIADQLSDRGFAVHSFADAMSLPAGLAASPDTDIILLDWDLPDVPGIVLLDELRQTGFHQPVVFLTGYASTAYEMLALNKGAVDFIDKTRGVDILASRLRRLLAVSKTAAPPAPIVRGKLVLHPNVGRAQWNSVDVGLTLGEYNIVHLLASKAGFCVTYRAIYDRVHYEGFIGGSGADGYRINVRGIIRCIRRKFLQCDETFAQLENFVGFGYRWAAREGLTRYVGKGDVGAPHGDRADAVTKSCLCP
jgi:two-component system response regulator ChvI